VRAGSGARAGDACEAGIVALIQAVCPLNTVATLPVNPVLGPNSEPTKEIQMQGRPSDETIRAFTREVSREVNAAVQRVAAQYGVRWAILLIDGQGSEEGEQALETLARIKSLI